MAASIDERIVSMAFENQVFEQRAAQTMTTLGKLNAAIKGMDSAKGLEDIEKSGSKVTLKGPMAALDKLKEKLGRSGDGAAQGFNDIEKASNKVTLEGTGRAIDKTQAKLDHLGAGSTFNDIEKAADQVDLAGISKAIDSVANKFGLLQNAASVALGGIAANAAMKGGSFAKSFALGPITQGLDEYKTNLGSIQTILANTQGQQISGLDEVNKHLGELNTYSDQTIYNFSEMAKNIGTFTAAGVDLDTSTQSIKGIANLAALSGSNSQQASTAMYQLSQAIASGKVGLQDWNSVVNAGMGGAVFQKALLRTADNMGAIGKGALKIDKATGKATVNGESFRESIMAKPGQKSWLTDEVLTNTLKQLTGDMTDAQLAAEGFTTEQIKAIQAQAQTAKAAATEVKTLPQVFDVARETIGSGWAKTFQLIFGDFNQSKKTFTEMSNFINGWINKVSNARNNMLEDWSKLGGRDELIGGIKQAFSDVAALLKPIREAFRDVFPAKTGKDLFNLTKSFHELMVDLRPSPAVINSIHDAFKIFFNVLDIGWNIIKGVAGVIGDLLGVVSKGQGGFATFISAISDFVDSIHDSLIEGGLLATFFEGLGDILKKPVSLLLKLGHLLAGLFTSGGEKAGGAALDGIDELHSKLPPLEKIIDNVKNAWSKLVDWFGKAKAALEPWLSSFVDKMSNLGNTIKNALSGIKFDDILKGVQTGIMAGFLVMFRDLFGKGGGLLDQVSKTMGSVSELLEGVTGNLKSMQKKVQAETILAIAGAVLALAGGVFILSTIDGDKLAKALAATAIGLGELGGALKLLTAGMGKLGPLLLPFIAAGLIGVAVAVGILALAMKLFATMDWQGIGKGLVGVAGSLGAIALGMKFMPTGPMMIAQAGGILIIGLALNAIAAALKALGGMKWADLGKGLYAVATALGILALTMGMMPPNMLVSAAALVVVSFALLTLSGAIRSMGSMDLGTMVKGIGGVMVALAALGVAMLPWAILGPALIPAAAGLFVVSGALVILGKALEIIGGIGIADLVKGLAAIGVALAELAVGMYLMIGTLPGAVAMLAAAAALAVLAPTLGLLGNMSWGTIFKGLAAIALVLGTIAVVGLVAAPALAALGIALIPLGVGFLLVAGAAKIFASALALLGDQGQKGISVFLVALTGFVAILPTIIISFVKGLVGIAEEVANVAPKVIAALAVILQQIIQFVADNAAKLALAVGQLVDAILVIVVQNGPKLVTAGISLLMSLLDGISQNISQITNKVSEIVVKFLGALRNKLPDLITAGANFLKSFLDGVGSKFGEIATSVGNLIAKFATAVGNQGDKIATAAATMMGKFLGALVTFGPTLLLTAAGAITDFLTGLASKGPDIIKRGTSVAGKLLKGIADGLVDLAKIGFKAVIDFLHGLAKAIRDNSTELNAAGIDVGAAIIEGVINGMSQLSGKLKDVVLALFKGAINAAKKVLKIHSPSKVFAEIGEFTITGFIQGMNDSKPALHKNIIDTAVGTMKGLAQGVTANQGAPVDAIAGTGGAMVNALNASLGRRAGQPSEVFRDIGMSVSHGFKDGLLGTHDDVLSAFDSLNSSLIDKIRDLRTQVSDGTNKIGDLSEQYAEKLADIAKLRSEKKPDQSAIDDAVKESEDLKQQLGEETQAVNQNSKALTAARNIRASLTGSMHDEKMQLLGLKKDYEDISKQLDEATSTLKTLTDERATAQQKYIDQYSAKPDIDSLLSDALANADLTAAQRQDKIRQQQADADKKAKIDQVALYVQALKDQLEATAKYQVTLQKLRELGLDDETYKKLLEKGLAGADFADALLKSGKKGIDQINALDSQILAKSTDLAIQTTKNLYDAGVAAAQGLVDGLTTKKADLDKAMTALADTMVNAIRSKLQIKSPSRIFAQIGAFTAQGLAKGLRDSSQAVTGAATALGEDAKDALSSSLSHILDTVGGEIDPTLTITPVLDLTQIRKDAAGITGLSNVIPISTATSFGQASATSQEVSASQQAAQDAAAASATPSVSLTQNNYSPEALNDVEIYRKTKNQIGQLKSALGIPATAA